MVAELEVVLRIHDVANALFHIVVAHVSPCYGHGVHGHDATGMLALVAEGVGQAEHRLDVALCLQAF